jgi:hypothetical protein
VLILRSSRSVGLRLPVGQAAAATLTKLSPPARRLRSQPCSRLAQYTGPHPRPVAGNLRLLARLTTEALVRAFPDYEPLRHRPFVFLGRRRELMRDAARVLGIDHPLLGDFRILPKYSLDARVLEVRDGSPFVGITVDLATRWEIVSGLEELQDAGVDLAGLFVVRRDGDPGQRRLVGRIGAVRAGRVELSEGTDNTATADVKSVMLEGRREAFARCLRHLLGRDYPGYEQYRDKQMGVQLDGAARAAQRPRRAGPHRGRSRSRSSLPMTKPAPCMEQRHGMDPTTPLGRSTRTTTSGSPATMWSTANNGIRREHLEGDPVSVERVGPDLADRHQLEGARDVRVEQIVRLHRWVIRPGN